MLLPCSVPADMTVYVSTKAPACPDMPKQQPHNCAGLQRAVLCMPRAPPSLFAGLSGVCSSSDKATASSDLSGLSRGQLLQHIAMLQDDNTHLTTKVSTLQALLGRMGNSGSRVKVIRARLEAHRWRAAFAALKGQAAPNKQPQATGQQQQQQQPEQQAWHRWQAAFAELEEQAEPCFAF
uniref:Uncharacterized protein n=1 Tax=Tetradesmus obliquus TaxID=3088 RepID=A0A383VTY3_TETOB|eukprot:jgi/Sobl393_1/1043/SZX77631.1